ncbi:hypothetical protein LEMLEM_LOCUS22780 [Lemmus lemmus]
MDTCMWQSEFMVAKQGEKALCVLSQERRLSMRCPRWRGSCDS